MNSLYRALLLSLAILLLNNGCMNHYTRVMVRSWAEEGYRKNVLAGDKPPKETYMIYRGQFEPGSIRDDSLIGEEAFLEIAGYLQKALATQNYIMAKPHDKLDLLIVVHWGQTTIDYETLYYEIETEGGFIEEFEHEQISNQSLKRNAQILGNTDKIYDSRHFSSYDKSEAISMTSDERYYFVCVAFDAKDLTKRKKTVRWITQFSAPVTGTNYLEALPSMTRVAANFFGQKIDDLSFEKTHLGEGEVTLGELEVIGYEENKKD